MDSILQFKLPHDFGFAYCKLVNYENVNTIYMYHIQVYDYFDNGGTKSASFFEDKEFFLNTIPIVKKPALRGKGAWKLLGEINRAIDYEIPYFKSPVQEGFAFDSLEDCLERKWEIVGNITNYQGPYEYTQVQHLEELYIRSTVSIEHRVAMELIRENNDNISDYYDIKKNNGDRADYNTMRFIPLYKKLPKAIREKPLIKGFVPDEYLNFDINKLLA